MFVNKKFDFSLPKSREIQQSCLLNVQQLFKYPGASLLHCPCKVLMRGHS